MSDQDSTFFGVQLPGYDGPAIHICRFPVPAPLPICDQVIVPSPKLAASDRGALALEALLLPEGCGGGRRPIVPTGIDGVGLSPLWVDDSESPLLLPVADARERRLRREWAVTMRVTPGSLGVQVPNEALAEVAWTVLCRVPRMDIAHVLAGLSVGAERHFASRDWLTQIVDLMRPPPAIAGRLRAAADAGEPLLDPRGIRWVLQELLVVSEAERVERARWRQRSTDAQLVAHAWFPCIRPNDAPSAAELLLAVWLLHGVFQDSAGSKTEPSESQLLSAVTAFAYRVAPAGSWLPTLDRWSAIWSVGDDHHALACSAVAPSSLRSLYAAALGLPVDRWLAGVWAVCANAWMGFDNPNSALITGDAEGLFTLTLGDRRLVLSTAFVEVFRRHCVTSIDDFAGAARAEAGDAYAGLGTLPHSDSLACRNSPVLEFPDGRLRLLSIDLVAERAVSLHRFLLQQVLGGARAVGSHIGKLFEAYVADQLDTLRPRHRVLHERELTAMVGEVERCDAVIGHDRAYLAIETSMQTLARTLAEGRFEALEQMAGRYQQEADQADATVARLSTITDRLGVPPPDATAHLVVTDLPVPHNPLFMRMLQTRRPLRTPRFVCGVAQLELLVALGAAGWSVPGLIAAWQGRPDDVSLETHLFERIRILQPRPYDHQRAFRRWLNNVPTSENPAA